MSETKATIDDKAKSDDVEDKTTPLVDPVRDDGVDPVRDRAQTQASAISNGVDKDIEDMFRAGVHFGYSRSRRHPNMNQYIFGLRNNVEVFDLEKVSDQLRHAEDFLSTIKAEGKTVLFVGTKASIAHLVEKAAREVEAPYVNNRWLGGLLTNFKVLRSRMDYFEDLKKKKTSGELAKYTKREQHEFEKEIAKLEKKFGGFVGLRALPAALVIVDVKEEKTATKEAIQLSIPRIGILNSDSNPEEATYPIPANDAAPASVEYLLNKLVDAYKKGRVAKITKK